MTRTRLILLISLILILGGGLLYLFSRSTNSLPQESGNIPEDQPSIPVVFPSSTPETASSSGTIQVGTGAGVVSVKDFRPTALAKSQGDYLIARTPEYDITYSQNGSEFLLALSAVPFADVRARAEQALLQSLGISQSDACKLSVVTRVDHYIDPDHAYRDWPLSFCVGR
jgi:hypothetical protein